FISVTIINRPNYQSKKHNMMLGNFGAFLLAPLLTTSSFLGFGANDGYAFANANLADRWQDATSEWRGDLSFNNNWDWGDMFTRKPVINRISPKEGEVGTEVRLSGSNFTDDSVVRLGDGVVNDVDVSQN